ncbi:uncharacterized protein LOC5513576 isoform X2 [Nematostella vectensis]|uniref:uncharacterized protein LOC5513576 isoform X2 n=1 Tax=Nematostella vectensis TaxID=45351 RepID=UPI00138FAA95|nr:uncharacterized protein LOC5513576 isoform X2 [Nematostella vectensis]
MWPTSIILLLAAQSILGDDKDDWMNVGDCGKGLICGPRCQQLCLIQHNYYRAQHKLAPLRCDHQLAESAQAWTDAQAQKGRLLKSPWRSLGRIAESIAWKEWAWQEMTHTRAAVPSAVRSWYSEQKDPSSPNTHYLTIVRNDVTRLGCGLHVRPNDGTYVTAHYAINPSLQQDSPEGHDASALQPARPEPACQVKSAQRRPCGDVRSPYVTPDECIKANCCYDDMFLDEPAVPWYSDAGRVWCYSSKPGVPRKNVPPVAEEADVQIKTYKGEPLHDELTSNATEKLSDSAIDKVYGGQDTSWMNVGNCGQGLTCDPECQLLCLKWHNYYRALHDAPPMSCDPKLAKSAQEWTDQQAKELKPYHSTLTGLTESISWRGWGWTGQKVMKGAIPGAVQGWYSEIKDDYNFKTGKGAPGKAIGHFQAVVWKGETKLGCGLTFKPGDPKNGYYGTYVTAHYAPPSNTGDKEKLTPSNVLPRHDPEPGCDVLSADREECSNTEDGKAPYVTPEYCVKMGCCFDDTYMKEKKVTFYSGKPWCFKKKSGAGGGPKPTTSPATTPTSGTEGAGTGGPGTGGPSGSSNPPTTGTPASASPTAPGVKGGANGGDCFRDSCYIFSSEGTSWTENREKCKSRNGDLVSMETEEEWSFINKKIQSLSNAFSDEWHIGLKQNGNSWNWVNGKPLAIDHWQPSQPSGDGEYVVIAKEYPPGTQGGFNDLRDDTFKGYICEVARDDVSSQPTQPNANTIPTPVTHTGPTARTTFSTNSGSTMGSTSVGTSGPGGSTSGGTSGPGGATSGGTSGPGGATLGGTSGVSTAPTAVPTTSSATSGGGGGAEEQIALDVHNKFRKVHDAPPMKLNAEMSKSAKAYAEKLAQMGKLVHSKDNEFGENLWFMCSSSKEQTPEKAVTDWYNEICKPGYDFNKPGFSSGTGHFTQVVWKGSVELGFGGGRAGRCTYHVGRYKKAGNMLGDFPNNVVKGSFDRASYCANVKNDKPMKDSEEKFSGVL